MTYPNGVKAFYSVESVPPPTPAKVIQEAMASGVLKHNDTFYLLGVNYPDIYVKQHQLNDPLPDDLALDLVVIRGGKTPFLDANT